MFEPSSLRPIIAKKFVKDLAHNEGRRRDSTVLCLKENYQHIDTGSASTATDTLRWGKLLVRWWRAEMPEVLRLGRRVLKGARKRIFKDLIFSQITAQKKRGKIVKAPKEIILI
jgi:hypothetical protein